MRNLWEDRGQVTRVKLRRKVSVAVMVLDDFTGRPIRSPDLEVTAAQVSGLPVRKQDGYFLFLDCDAPALDIAARAWAYHPGTVRVEPATLPPLHPVIKLRLTPNRNYAIPQQTTCLEGEAPAGSQIRVICANDPRPLRLLYDYKRSGEAGGRLIQLYTHGPGDLDGRLFALMGKAGEASAFFQVRETLDAEEGRYLMDAPLERDQKKAGTTILPVSAARADAKGAFFLPLRSLPVKRYQCRVLWAPPGGVWQEQALELECGRATRLALAP